MAAEQGFVQLSAEHVSAGSVIVTPSEQPLIGRADLSRALTPSRTTGCLVSVDGATLVCALPKWAAVGDTVFWTSYA